LNKGLKFFRDIITSVVSERELEFGICKATDILLDLKIDDEQIKQILVKHFDIRYSQAENLLIEAKEYHNI